jgi:exosortase
MNSNFSSAEIINEGSCSGVAGGERVRRRRIQRTSIPWSRILEPSDWLKILALGVLICWFYWHDINSMVSAWIHDGNWSHGFIIPLFSLYFLHQRREQLYLAERKSSWVGFWLIIFSFFIYLASIYPLQMGYPRYIAMLLTIFGVVVFCCGWKIAKIAWLPIFYLFFAMPLPVRMYVSLTMPMRRWASKVAAAALDLIPNLDATAVSIVIEGTYKGQPFPPLNVAEACAGMRLMMAFFALSVAMAYLSDRPYWHRIILVLSAFPIALFCNFVRVTITGVLFILVDPRLAEGMFHTMLGLLMLPLAFFLYWLIAMGLNNIYEEVEVAEEGQDD